MRLFSQQIAGWRRQRGVAVQRNLLEATQRPRICLHGQPGPVVEETLHQALGAEAERIQPRAKDDKEEENRIVTVLDQ